MESETYAVPGFDASGVAAGIKKNGGLDLALIASRVPCAAAAVFTQNLFPAAPVLHGRQLLSFNNDAVHGVLINSGCANACTGTPGSANTRLTAEAVEQAIGASDNSVFVMSTGVIGVQLPMRQLLGGIAPAVEALTPEGWRSAAQAIMTTDTLPKLETRTVTFGADPYNAPCRITGIAKGAGMIHPNMATMLSVIATDAAIAPELLQRALEEAVSRSFNRISIDGDTSTNDGVILLANGLCGGAPIESVDDTRMKHLLQHLRNCASRWRRRLYVTVRAPRSSSQFMFTAHATQPRPTPRPMPSPRARLSRPPSSAATPTGGGFLPPQAAQARRWSRSEPTSSLMAAQPTATALASSSLSRRERPLITVKRTPPPSLRSPRLTCASSWAWAAPLPRCGRAISPTIMCASTETIVRSLNATIVREPQCPLGARHGRTSVLNHIATIKRQGAHPALLAVALPLRFSAPSRLCVKQLYLQPSRTHPATARA